MTTATPTATPASKPVTVTFQVTDQLCGDMLTTCVEGGSSYWLACDNYERDADMNVTKVAGCRGTEDDGRFGDATLETMRVGIQRILAGSVNVRDDVRGNVLDAVVDEDSTAWDAETADLVLQAGLLNEIVYG